jgi:hypothetical protein
MDVEDETMFSSSTSVSYPQLISLTISNDIQLSIQNLESLLSLTPSLVRLKLVATRSELDSVFNSSFWEQLIRNNLLLLREFEFFFAYTIDNNIKTPSLDFIVAPFRASFWLDDKHWFVACNYAIRSSQIRLITTPPCIDNFEILVSCEASSKNSVCRFIDLSINETAGAIPKEVCVKFFLLNRLK